MVKYICFEERVIAVKRKKSSAKTRKRRKVSNKEKIVKIICAVLAVYLVYVAAFAFFPYFTEKNVSETFRTDIESYDFYSDTQSVDRVALVEDPLVSLGTRIRLISEAKSTLDISYHSMHMGESADYFLAAILDAAERGVKVRLLFDGMSSGFSGKYKDLAKALGSHENIEIRLYNSMNLLKPWTFNGRMHDKYIIIDNKFLLLGGRNIGDQYFGPEGYDKNLSIDRDVLVYNSAWQTDNRDSVLFQVKNYMENIWNCKNSKDAFTEKGKNSDDEKARLLSIMTELRKEQPRLFSQPLNIEKATFPTNKITFFANDISIYKKEPKVGYIISHLVMNAEEKVFLQSPYVVLSDNIETALNEIGKKGIKYEILTNSLQSSPNLPAYSLYLNDREKILSTGAEIYEFQNNNGIHAKTYIIDDRMSIIGSFNMDPRSEYIDTEIMLAIDSPEFTEYLQSIVKLYKDNSLVVGSDGEYIPNPDVEEFEVSSAKRFAFEVGGTLLSPFRVLV